MKIVCIYMTWVCLQGKNINLNLYEKVCFYVLKSVAECFIFFFYDLLKQINWLFKRKQTHSPRHAKWTFARTHTPSLHSNSTLTHSTMGLANDNHRIWRTIFPIKNTIIKKFHHWLTFQKYFVNKKKRWICMVIRLYYFLPSLSYQWFVLSG